MRYIGNIDLRSRGRNARYYKGFVAPKDIIVATGGTTEDLAINDGLGGTVNVRNHTFTSSGNFTISSITKQGLFHINEIRPGSETSFFTGYQVVAGGGGGGGSKSVGSGGGGGGWVIEAWGYQNHGYTIDNNMKITPTTINVVVGAGGAGGTANQSANLGAGANGGDSTLNNIQVLYYFNELDPTQSIETTLSMFGGGGGAGGDISAADGSRKYFTSATTQGGGKFGGGGDILANHGGTGGSYSDANAYRGGGGGAGIGGNGSNAGSYPGGSFVTVNGGAGGGGQILSDLKYTNFITNASTRTYGGGGGGGGDFTTYGGIAGGQAGAGGKTGAGSNAVANSGSGGGGAGYYNSQLYPPNTGTFTGATGGNGSAGKVIIQYYI